MAERIEARLKELGIILPALPQPGGNYLPARTVGQIVYLAGVISIHERRSDRRNRRRGTHD